MPETCGEPHPSRPEVTCEKPTPCYDVHYSLTAQIDWDGPPSPPPPPPAKTRRAQVATMASHIPPASRTGPPEAERAHARHNDPDTSHEAAASVSDIRERQRYVLTCLEHLKEATDEELVEAYPRYDLPRQSTSGIRTRRRELADLGLVVQTGAKRVMSSGRRGHVWRLAQPGDRITQRSGHSCPAVLAVERIQALAKTYRARGETRVAESIEAALGGSVTHPSGPVTVPDFD